VTWKTRDPWPEKPVTRDQNRDRDQGHGGTLLTASMLFVWCMSLVICHTRLRILCKQVSKSQHEFGKLLFLFKFRV
jgi:hypothetical protein